MFYDNQCKGKDSLLPFPTTSEMVYDYETYLEICYETPDWVQFASDETGFITERKKVNPQIQTQGDRIGRALGSRLVENALSPRGDGGGPCE